MEAQQVVKHTYSINEHMRARCVADEELHPAHVGIVHLFILE